MITHTTKPEGQPRQLWRSAAAVLLGFAAAAALTLSTDQLMTMLKLFQHSGRPADAPFVLATVYRIVYNVAGCYIAARLAPYRPMRHALIIGWVGLVFTTLNTVATWTTALGPHWYPLANVIVALPCAWLGGFLERKWHVERGVAVGRASAA